MHLNRKSVRNPETSSEAGKRNSNENELRRTIFQKLFRNSFIIFVFISFDAEVCKNCAEIASDLFLFLQVFVGFAPRTRKKSWADLNSLKCRPVREMERWERWDREREREGERGWERREEGHGNKRGVWQSNYVKKVGNKKIQTNQTNHRMSCDVDSLPRSCTDEGIVGDLRNNLA